MALSKVLEKMAKSHQTTGEAPTPNIVTEQDAGAAGILLSLLTEPPQQKQQSQPNTNQAAVSPTANKTSSVMGSDCGKPNDMAVKSNDDPASAVVMNEIAANDKYSPRSVLLQLLQEHKMNLGTSSGKTIMVDGCKRELGDSQYKTGIKPKPIIITPGVHRPSDHSAQGVDAARDDCVEDSACSSSDVQAVVMVNSSTTLCHICQRGFWDTTKYTEHMEAEHGQVVKLISTLESSMRDDSLSSSPSPAATSSALEIAASKSASPASVIGVDEGGLRRSKRKRTPARMKYVHEEVQEDEVELEELQPKILCVEGNVKNKSFRPVSREDNDIWSMGSESEQTSLESGWNSSTAVVTSVRIASKPNDQKSGDSEDQGECSEEGNVIEEITSYRCSQCFLYFNSREETRVHLQQEHNILSSHNPTATPTGTISTAASALRKSSASVPCTSCGCHNNGESKKSALARRCVVCGKTETPGIKPYINIFRARTWSSRHHQLARRLSSALGCKFSFATCRSRTVCHTCVQKLENIEKASMQLRQMIRGMKRTLLVNSCQTKLKGIQQRMVKTANNSLSAGSCSAEKGNGNCNSTNVNNPSYGSHNVNQVPSAPLVRELLATPEVVLPQSQFSELLDALGSDKESASSSSINLTSRVAVPEIPSASSGSQRSGERRPGLHSRRLPTIQHNDTAFSEFVNELRAKQGPLGHVLAEVRVKQEPGSEHADTQINTKCLGSLVPAAYVPNKAVDGLSVIEDLSALYTKLQIDSCSGQTEYTCTLCNNSFYSEAAIQLHVKCHLPRSKDLKCFLCGYHNNLLPSQWRIMKRHLESEHNFPETYFHRYPCPVRGCAELFRCHREMMLHVSKVHRTPARVGGGAEHALAEVGLFNFPCHMCGTLLQSDAALQVHILCHNGSPKHYQCAYCGYMHPSQPGSWRIMRGHLNKEHINKELSADVFAQYECPYYACRLKFCTKKAQIVHRACHDETKDCEFFCFQCHWSLPSTPYLWEKVRDHIIAKHPEAVGETFRCACSMQFLTMREFVQHMNQVNAANKS